MGFGVPIGHWLDGRLRGSLQETLLSEKALGRDLYNPATVKRIVDEHVEGQTDHAHQRLMLSCGFNDLWIS